MNKPILIVWLLLAAPAFAQTDSQWVLGQSTLTYHVSHPLHQVDGVSHAARGKGVCHAGQCDFLIAVPVNLSIRATATAIFTCFRWCEAGNFPWSPCALNCPKRPPSATIQADLEVQFAGQ